MYENVKGLVTLQKRRRWCLKKLFTEFESVGYKVKYIKYSLASNFGITTKRERVFIVDAEIDIDINYKFPTETHFRKQSF